MEQQKTVYIFYHRFRFLMCAAQQPFVAQQLPKVRNVSQFPLRSGLYFVFYFIFIAAK